MDFIYICTQKNTILDMSYLPRIADNQLEERLEAFGAVLIEGPKWCGKTTTAEQISKSIIRMQDPDMREEYAATAASKPSLLLLGDTPRLIDEWQDAPVLWDAIRTMVDRRQSPGQFILTGSNAVDKTKILHSGTGRISRMKMQPMSLWESNESNGRISLMELFNNKDLDIDGIKSNMKIEDLINAACRGGWPAFVNMKSDRAKLLIARDYVDTVCRDDISRVDGIKRDERITRAILRSYARNISTLAKNTSLLADVTASGEVSLVMSTFEDYVTSLKRLFVIENIEAWCPSIRSKTALRSGLKRGFIDPSIAVAALNLTPQALMTQLKTFGFIFEQMCARDLRAYTPGFGSHLSYYRDRYGLEADLVLHLDDGRYALIECKLGSNEIEEGSKHLLELKRLIQEHNKGEEQVPLREPDLLIILTGGSIAYTRPDGVKIIPLACLKD
jgi:predicted AAA+ superfamily ATPase